MTQSHGRADLTAGDAEGGLEGELLPLLGSSVRVLQPPRSESDGPGGGDLDCAVEGLDPLWPLRLPAGWRLLQCLHYDIAAWYWVVERDGQVLAIDTLDDPKGISAYAFPTRLAFTTGDEALNGVRAAYLTAKRLGKGLRDSARWAHIRACALEAPDVYRAALEDVFGKSVSSALAEVVIGGGLPEPDLWRRARHAMWMRRLRDPQRVWSFVRGSTMRIAGRLVRPSGLMVVVAGPDGTGKSSLAGALPWLCRGPFRRTDLFHWRPGLLPRAGALAGIEGRDPTQPHSGGVQGAIASLARLLYYWTDFMIGGWLRWRPLTVRSGLVIVERGWWDMGVDPTRYRFQVAPALVRVLGRSLFGPDLTLVLEASPKVLRQRKGELTDDEARRQTLAWRRVLPRRSRHRFLDATRPEEYVQQEATRSVFDVLEDRTVARLRGGWVGLPRRTAPRWTIPRGPSSVTRASLSVYQPVTLRGLLGWHAARLGAASGAFRLLPRGSAPPPAVRRALAPHLKPHDTFAVLRANHPGRYVALIVSREGNCSAVAKVATDVEGRLRLEREAEMIERAGPLLRSPLSAPRVRARAEGMILLEAVTWRPRLRPWALPPDVARALGRLYRSTGGDEGGLGHGDCAPWNLLRTPSGWTLVDWEECREDAPPFFDLFHYFVQAHALLGRPSGGALLRAVQGRDGGMRPVIESYCDGAGLPLSLVQTQFCNYLETSAALLESTTPDGRAGIRARRQLLDALGR